MARDADFMLTPEERQTRARKRRRRWIIAIAAVVLLAIAAIAARPTRNAIKAWQARRQAEKAFALIEQEKWKEAQTAAVAAYQLRSTEPEALRALARFLSRVRQPQAFEFWDKLKQHQPLTPADLRDEAGVALALGDKVRAEAAVATRMAADTPTAADWLLSAQLQLMNGARDKALEQVGKAIADPNVTPREQFQASVLQLQAARTGNGENDGRSQGEAWERIHELGTHDDAVGLDSLLLLAQRQLSTKSEVNGQESATADPSSGGSGVTGQDSDIRSPTSEITALSDAQTSPTPAPQSEIRNPKSEITALSEALSSHPLAKTPQKLLALDLLIQAEPTRRAELIDRAVSEWKNGDIPALVALATWLNGKGEFQRNLDSIPLEAALQSNDLFLQHVDALGALGRWEAIRQLLDAERFPLDPVIQHMYLARTNAQLGNKMAAENSWQRALEAASGDVRKLMMLAEYAEKNGIPGTAGAAYEQATSVAPKLRPAWAGRLRAAQAAKDTRRMHNTLVAMLELWPEDAAIQNDEAYTRLLLIGSQTSGIGGHQSAVSGTAARSNEQETTDNPANSQELAAIEQLAERLVAANPTSLPHRTLLALSRLKQGRPADALGVYDGIQVAANALTPSALVVHAAVLHANGHVEDARSEMSQLSEEALLPEEAEATAKLRD